MSYMSLLCNGGDNISDLPFLMLLLLPPEIICKILHYLPLVDRLNARVCRTLYEIESKGKYYEWFANFKIVDQRISRYRYSNDSHEKSMVYTESAENYVNALTKLFTNTFFLNVNFVINSGYGDLLKFVIAASTKVITVQIEDIALRNELSIETIEEIMKEKDTVTFSNALPCLTANFLLNVYQRMQSGTDELANVMFSDVGPSIIRGFLASIGLRFIKKAKFLSVNKNIKVFWMDTSMYSETYIISIGNIGIYLDDKILDSRESGTVYIQKQEYNIDDNVGLSFEGDTLFNFPIKAFEDIDDLVDIDVDYVEQFEAEEE